MSGRLIQLPDDRSEHGQVMTVDGGVGDDHPMRKVTRQVAFGAGWSSERARKVADLFDGMAGGWDSTHSDPIRLAPVADAVARGGMNLDGRWLELGAGTGAGTRLLAPAVAADGGFLAAADLALQMLKSSPHRVAPLVQADASRLPFPDNRLDGIALVNMLLFPDEVNRILRASGQLMWVNTLGDRTPIHLAPEDVLLALPGEWAATWARSGTGFWMVASRV